MVSMYRKDGDGDIQVGIFVIDRWKSVTSVSVLVDPSVDVGAYEKPGVFPCIGSLRSST